MATPHVSGAAALLWAQNQPYRAAGKEPLLLNGDVVSALIE